MLIRPILLLALAAGSAASAQQSAQDRAHAFTLDSVAQSPEPSPTPTATDPAVTPPSVPASTAVTTPADAAAALRLSFTLDTPIADLIADPAAKGVLDKDLPGLSSDENLDKFAKLGLRQFQPLTGGQLTDAMLAKVARDLSSLAGPMLAPVAPASAGTSKRNRDASR